MACVARKGAVHRETWGGGMHGDHTAGPHTCLQALTPAPTTCRVAATVFAKLGWGHRLSWSWSHPKVNDSRHAGWWGGHKHQGDRHRNRGAGTRDRQAETQVGQGEAVTSIDESKG